MNNGTTTSSNGAEMDEPRSIRKPEEAKARGRSAARLFLYPTAFVVLAILSGEHIGTSGQLKAVLWLSFAIAALSLDFVWGKAGIFSFGQNALFGLGGYAYAIVALNVFPHTFETTSALLAAATVGAIFAAILGYVMFYGDVGDVYLAIVTLAVTLVLYTVMQSTAGPEYRIGEALLGGFNGIPSVPTIALGVPGNEENQELSSYGLFVFSVILTAAIYICIRSLTQSKFGLILEGIKENEVRMGLLGYDVRKYKLAAFTLGGAIAGIGGGVFAAWGMFINPVVFSLGYAALIVIWVMVGGRGTLAGAFVGVVVVQWISDEADRLVEQQTPLILGVILVAVVLLFPSGIYPTVRRVIMKLSPLRNLATATGFQSISISPAHMPSHDHRQSEAHRVGVRNGRHGTISAHDIRKAFGGVVVLDSVSLDFEGPGVYAIIGPNGAGKSTFFSTLTGRNIVDQGEITLNGSAVTKLRPYRRTRLGLGIKMQVPSIFLGLTVEENLKLATGPGSGNVVPPIVTEVLDGLGLRERAQLTAETLSHGEQQWLEICMVLMQEPAVILLDEPAAGMTKEERLNTVRLISKLGKLRTVIVVEHDMSFIKALNSPVVMLDRGKVFKTGSFEALRSDPEVIRIYMGRRHDTNR